MAEKNKSSQTMGVSARKESLGGTRIRINIRTMDVNKKILIWEEFSVAQLRQEVSKRFDMSQDQLVLIFTGKILKDTETLKHHGIKDGHTVHLVIKNSPDPTGGSASQTSSTSSPAQLNTSSSNISSPSAGGNSHTLTQNPDATSGLDLSSLLPPGTDSPPPGQMEPQMLPNPQFMSQIMGNPLFQDLMSNLNLMRQMMAVNPQMQQLFERNISHLLNNPEFIRQLENPETISLMTNPRVRQALDQLQQSLQTLQTEVPGFMSSVAPGFLVPPSTGGVIPPPRRGNAPPPRRASVPPSTRSPVPPSTGGFVPPQNVPPGDSPPGPSPYQQWQQIQQIQQMQQMLQMFRGGGQLLQAPEANFQQQLDQLNTMGFTDHEANVQALILARGNINVAVDRLLS